MMRVPNGQSFSVEGGKHMAVTFAADTLWRCDELFTTAIREEKRLVFEASDSDITTLATYYTDIPSKEAIIEEFINEALVLLKPPHFRITAARRISDTHYLASVEWREKNTNTTEHP